ncbi:hypothetical protein [Vibrio rarus]|uniref:hypothetical protein n=1 Tax=Vibrio rarus TaxID=413403 RepID=UPI0021C25665|nr:hypothetical protein [Vibrio rarus]
MTKTPHPLDSEIIRVLQQQGLIKSEAKALIKKKVYKLHKDEVHKIQNYVHHFGIAAKNTIIDEILDVRRETMLSTILQSQSTSSHAI